MESLNNIESYSFIEYKNLDTWIDEENLETITFKLIYKDDLKKYKLRIHNQLKYGSLKYEYDLAVRFKALNILLYLQEKHQLKDYPKLDRMIKFKLHISNIQRDSLMEKATLLTRVLPRELFIKVIKCY